MPIRIEHDGRSLTISEWAAEAGVSRQTLYNRMQRGLTGEELLAPPDPSLPGGGRGSGTGRPIRFRGRSQSALEWSRETGIPVATINSRLRYGWTACRALTTPVDAVANSSNRRMLTVDGERLSAAEWARRKGFPPYLIPKRLARGWSARRAVLTPMQRRADSKKA